MNIESYVQHIKNNFQQQLITTLKTQQHVPLRLMEALNYSVLNSGKCFRPLLVYCSGNSLGIDEQRLHPIAIAIELIHVYSLIHDDLPAMDNARLRRGKKTCHLQFGEAEAILTGDALQMMAIEILINANFISDRNKIELIKILTSAAGPRGMVGGQALDILAECKESILTELEQIHSMKTGALIKACILMPASLAPHVSIKDLDHLAEILGKAYQIQDDILDIESNSIDLGKENGNDIKLNKSTFPKLLGLENSKIYLQQLRIDITFLLEKMLLQGSNLAQLIELIFKRTY